MNNKEIKANRKNLNILLEYINSSNSKEVVELIKSLERW